MPLPYHWGDGLAGGTLGFANIRPPMPRSDRRRLKAGKQTEPCGASIALVESYAASDGIGRRMIWLSSQCPPVWSLFELLSGWDKQTSRIKTRASSVVP